MLTDRRPDSAAVLRNNRYFELLRTAGYRTRVLQTSYIDLCGGRADRFGAEECVAYPTFSLSPIMELLLPHDVHLFAFITDDFRRMGRKHFGTYGKPMVRLRDQELVVENLPVPKASSFSLLLAWFSREFTETRSMQLGKRIWRPAPQRSLMSDEETRSTALRMFEELHRLGEERRSTLVLVYLPWAQDYFTSDSDVLRRYFKNEALRRKVLFVDVVEAYRNLSSEEARQLYIRPWEGHFSRYGNQWVARVLYEQLVTAPRVKERLKRAGMAG